jgi:hypothetical protein
MEESCEKEFRRIMPDVLSTCKSNYISCSLLLSLCLCLSVPLLSPPFSPNYHPDMALDFFALKETVCELYFED